MPVGRFEALIDEAVAEGFTEVYVTGGEPFMEPDIVAMLEYASDRVLTVVLTNAMLFRGRQRAELERLAGRDRLILQTSVDGATAEAHDRNRGDGSWARTMQGVELATSLGLRLRVGMTETAENRREIPALRRLLAGFGVTGGDFAVRPLVRRGFAAGGVEIDDANTVPELTVTMDGVHWHPAGADVGTSPDMLLAAGAGVPLDEAKRLVTERFLRLRQDDGSLPVAYNCAV
jgi:MoaA/NifB/PqqE/SkfB family radical SAM enzyme